MDIWKYMFDEKKEERRVIIFQRSYENALSNTHFRRISYPSIFSFECSGWKFSVCGYLLASLANFTSFDIYLRFINTVRGRHISSKECFAYFRGGGTLGFFEKSLQNNLFLYRRLSNLYDFVYSDVSIDQVNMFSSFVYQMIDRMTDNLWYEHVYDG
mgnify:CR=1 FL=1